MDRCLTFCDFETKIYHSGDSSGQFSLSNLYSLEISSTKGSYPCDLKEAKQNVTETEYLLHLEKKISFFPLYEIKVFLLIYQSYNR